MNVLEGMARAMPLVPREKTACFSGHRIIAPDQKARVVAALRAAVDLLIAEGFMRFICGGALGFDTLAAQAVLTAREKNPDVCLCLALPYKGQEGAWPQADKVVYAKIMAAADEVHYTSEAYDKACMHVRNRYMVDHSSVLVTYCNRASGGTVYTIGYAAAQNVRRVHLYGKE